jgi:hypothetical protein
MEEETEEDVLLPPQIAAQDQLSGLSGPFMNASSRSSPNRISGQTRSTWRNRLSFS